MYRRFFVTIAAVIAFSLGLFPLKQGFCVKVPGEDTNMRYLYVFGEDGKKSYGAKKQPQVIFLMIPEDYTGEMQISIYDPDVGGYIDEKSGKWDTETRFSIFGGKRAYSSIAGLSEAKITDFSQGTLLDAKKFGEDKSFDREVYHFTPIEAVKGEKIGKFRYFKVLAEGLSGDDNNVFSLEVSPDSVQAFSYSLSIRLSEVRGTKMALYPFIPLGTSKIIEYNYDVDPQGGEIELISATKSYKIKASGTGVWANTKVDISPSEAGKRWVYEITKDRQPNANMAVYLTTDDGAAIPVFFAPGPDGPKRVFLEKKVVVKEIEKVVEKKAEKIKKEEPWMDSKLSCNTFTFDGSKSYDPDRQEMTYFWDFGDGATSSKIRSMHTYKDAGKYLVRLTVTDNSEVDCNTATTQQIVEVNEPPCAIVEGPDVACVETELD
ncbi:MAG: PKD domain-containing protein, partial [Candidatus Omnitrophica bacterium]|nr:PKD domain-containing protein [Candidatus Omnitrophota bacterium]